MIKHRIVFGLILVLVAACGYGVWRSGFFQRRYLPLPETGTFEKPARVLNWIAKAYWSDRVFDLEKQIAFDDFEISKRNSLLPLGLEAKLSRMKGRSTGKLESMIEEHLQDYYEETERLGQDRVRHID